MGGWMDGWLAGWLDGYMDGWMDAWMLGKCCLFGVSDLLIFPGVFSFKKISKGN
jgi:hypothetical protein